MAVFFSGCKYLSGEEFVESQTAEAEQIIRENGDYRTVNDICNKIEIPPTSALVGKSRLYNSVGISHHYRVITKIDEIEIHFIKVMKRDEWTPVENKLLSRILNYKKGDLAVEIQLSGLGADYDYSITCKKTP